MTKRYTRRTDRDAKRMGGFPDFWGAPWTWASTPIAMMRRFAEEMERAMNGPGMGSSWPNMDWNEHTTPGGPWSPQVELFEQHNTLVVRVDLPGLSKQDVEVEIREDALIVQGERRKETEEQNERFYHSERSYGRFYRNISLPEGTRTDEAVARFHDGVLEVRIPMSPPEERTGRRLDVL